jgi:fructose-1,6-bisphosphatase/inositol monophosphatase family enzyme
MTDYQEYLTFAEEVAREAGLIARKHFSHVVTFETKTDNTPVTAADLAINELVIRRCTSAFPGIGVLGEEQSIDGDIGQGLLWVCDPIDGTIPYSFGMGLSTFCLALVEDGVPKVGVVYDFINNRLFSAIEGKGAWLNGEKIQPHNDAQPMKFIDLEWWLNAPFDIDQATKQLAVEGYNTVRYMSCVFAGVMVGLRRMSGVIYAGDKPWDAAALYVIAREMGARMTDLGGNEQRYDQAVNGFVLATQEDFDIVLDAVMGVNA